MLKVKNSAQLLLFSILYTHKTAKSLTQLQKKTRRPVRRQVSLEVWVEFI